VSHPFVKLDLTVNQVWYCFHYRGINDPVIPDLAGTAINTLNYESKQFYWLGSDGWYLVSHVPGTDYASLYSLSDIDPIHRLDVKSHVLDEWFNGGGYALWLSELNLWISEYVLPTVTAEAVRDVLIEQNAVQGNIYSNLSMDNIRHILDKVTTLLITMNDDSIKDIAIRTYRRVEKENLLPYLYAIGAYGFINLLIDD
jgi:hypothetical protein